MLKLREPFSPKVQLHIKENLLQRLWDKYVPETASVYGQIKLIYLKNAQEEQGGQPQQVQLLLHLLIKNRRMQFYLLQNPQVAGTVPKQLVRSLQRVERYYSAQLKSADRTMYQTVRQYFSLLEQAQEDSRRYQDWQRQYQAIERQKEEYRLLSFFTERLQERFTDDSIQELQALRAAEREFIQTLPEAEYQALAEELVWQEKPWLTAYLKECSKDQCKEIVKRLEKDTSMKRVLSSIQKQSAKKKLIAAAYKLEKEEFSRFYWQVMAHSDAPQEDVLWKESRTGMLDGFGALRLEALQKIWTQIHEVRPGKESQTLQEQYQRIKKDSLLSQIDSVLKESDLEKVTEIVNLASEIRQLLQDFPPDFPKKGAEGQEQPALQSGADRVLAYLLREQEIRREQIRQQQVQAVEAYRRVYGGQMSNGKYQGQQTKNLTQELTKKEFENVYEWSRAFLENCLVVLGQEDRAVPGSGQQDGLEYKEAPELRYVLGQINDHIERQHEPTERLTLRWQEQLTQDRRIQGLLLHIQALEEEERTRLVQYLADMIWLSVRFSSQDMGSAQDDIREHIFDELSKQNGSGESHRKPLQAEDRAFAEKLLAVGDREFARRLLWTEDREFAEELLAVEDRSFAEQLLQIADQKFARELLQTGDQKLAGRLLQMEDQEFARKLLQVEDREFVERLLQMEDQEFAGRLLQMEDRGFAEKLMQDGGSELPEVSYRNLWEWGTTLLYQPAAQREREDADLLSVPGQERFPADGGAQQEDVQTQMIRRQIEMAKDRNRLQGLIRQINHQTEMELVYTDAQLGLPQVQSMLRYIQQLDERQYGVLVRTLAQIAVVQKQSCEVTQIDAADWTEIDGTGNVQPDMGTPQRDRTGIDGAEIVYAEENQLQIDRAEGIAIEKNLLQIDRAEGIAAEKNPSQTGQEETVQVNEKRQDNQYESAMSSRELLRQEDNLFIEKLLVIEDREFAEKLLRLENRTFAEKLLDIGDRAFAEKLLRITNETFAEKLLQLLQTKDKAYIERLMQIEDQEFAEKLLRVENQSFAEKLLAIEDREFAKKLLRLENGEFVEKLLQTQDKTFTEKLLQLFQTEDRVSAVKLLHVESRVFAERLLATENQQFARKLLQLEDGKFAEELLQVENRELLRKLPDMSYGSLWAWGKALLNHPGQQETLAVSGSRHEAVSDECGNDSAQQEEQEQHSKDQFQRLISQISQQTDLHLTYTEDQLRHPQVQELLQYIQRLDEQQYNILVRELAQITEIQKQSYSQQETTQWQTRGEKHEPASRGLEVREFAEELLQLQDRKLVEELLQLQDKELAEKLLQSEDRNLSGKLPAVSYRSLWEWGEALLFHLEQQEAFPADNEGQQEAQTAHHKVRLQRLIRQISQQTDLQLAYTDARLRQPQVQELLRYIQQLDERQYSVFVEELSQIIRIQNLSYEEPTAAGAHIGEERRLEQRTISYQILAGVIQNYERQRQLEFRRNVREIERKIFPRTDSRGKQRYVAGGRNGESVYSSQTPEAVHSVHSLPMYGEVEPTYSLPLYEPAESAYSQPFYEAAEPMYNLSIDGAAEPAYNLSMSEGAETAYKPSMYEAAAPAYNVSPDQAAARKYAQMAAYREPSRENRELSYFVQGVLASEDDQQQRVALRMQHEAAQMKSAQQQLDQKLKEMEGQLKRVEDSAKAKEDVRTFAEQVKRQLYEELHVEKLRRGLI